MILRPPLAAGRNAAGWRVGVRSPGAQAGRRTQTACAPGDRTPTLARAKRAPSVGPRSASAEATPCPSV